MHWGGWNDDPLQVLVSEKMERKIDWQNNVALTGEEKKEEEEEEEKKAEVEVY